MIIEPTIIKTTFDFTSHAPTGSEFTLVKDTYESNVCDCCGNRRKCDLFVHFYTNSMGYKDTVFLDLCRSCRKKQTEVTA